MPDNFNYSDKLNHVEQRSELSVLLKHQITELQSSTGGRADWPKHTRFAGEAEFWMQVHRALLGATSTLPQRCATMMLLDEPSERKKHLTQISQLGGQLIHHAHTHHHVEDHHFFPIFKTTYPKLNHHLELLDGDHHVLTEALDQLETALRTLPVRTDQSRNGQSEFKVKTEQLLAAARRVDKLFNRHIADEEEICIPAILQL